MADRDRAYEALLDKLLASPHYGERWGRHWLDVAGYADSDGYLDADRLRPEAWRYRDYVIQSLNDDVPYDQFLTEQLAGDELSDWRRAAELGRHGAARIRLVRHLHAHRRRQRLSHCVRRRPAARARAAQASDIQLLNHVAPTKQWVRGQGH